MERGTINMNSAIWVMVGESSRATLYKEKEAQDFAKNLGEILENGRLKNQYNQLVLCASPHFLGLLRQQLTSPTSSRVVAEIDKNLIKSPPAEIEQHIHNALFS